MSVNEMVIKVQIIFLSNWSLPAGFVYHVWDGKKAGYDKLFINHWILQTHMQTNKQ